MRAALKSLFALTLLTVPSFASAQTSCAQREFVVKRLATGYGETFQGGGIQSEEKVFEVWYSEEDGTWTILMTQADGVSCIMASGTDWREPLPSDKVPAGVPG